MELQNLGVDECVRMLLRCYTSIETRAYLDEASRIVERLGCLPLAVDQAASYLAFRKHPIKEIGQFLELYEKQREIVLKHIPTESWEYSGIDEFDKPTALSAITTWEMSLQQLQGKPNTEVDSVIHLLSLCAFLAPITIPEFMFQWYWGGRFWWIDRWGADHNRAAWLHTDRERLVTEDTLRRWRAYNPNNMVLTHTQTLRAREMPWAKKVLTGIPEYLASSISQLVSYVKRQNKSVQGNQNLESGNAAFVWDTGHFWDIISLCDSLSLIRGLKREENSEGSFSLHPVIRDWLQLRLTWKETSEYIKEATALVATCADCYMSSGSPQSRKTLLSAHMDECLQQDNRLTMVVPIDEEGMEYDWTMRLISLFYYEQRRFEPAMKILRVALAPVRLAKLASIDPRRRWHGIAYQDVVRLVHNGLRFQLYAIYDDLGLHSDAQSLLSTIIESYSSSTILGEHPDSANMLMLQVAKVQQEGLTERTFEFAHRIVSMDHDASGLIGPMAFKGISLTDLAKTPEDVHRAATMLRDTMNVVNLEDDSAIDVNLSTTIKLAGLLSTQNRNEEAEKLVSAALTHYDKSERAGHPKVLELMRTAASISRVRGELDLSYSMYHALLQRQEIVYCPNTIDVLETKFQLGAILAQQHRYEQAEIYLRSTVSLQEETLGHDHPETLRTKSVLASVCYDTRQYASSEILWREVLAVESPPGRLGLLDRIDAAAGLRQLQLSIDVQACSLFNAEKYPEARAVWQRGLDITQKDENDDFEFMCIRQVGVCCTLLGLHTEAESYLSPCLERQKAVVGEDHGDTILMIALGDTLFHQGKYHQALDLFLKVEQLESKSTPGTPVLMETRVKCACSFRELKEYIKAENMVRAVLEMDESLFSADPHESQKHNAASLLIDVLVSRAADASSEKTYDIAETLCHEIVYIAKAYALEGISLMKYAQLILADSLFRQNRSDEAKSTLLELLKDPDEDDPPIPPMIGARLLLGEIYAGEAQWDTARHSFKEALSVLPNCHEENVPAMTAAARYWLGKTNHELGSQQEAGMLLLQQVLEYDDDVLTEAEIDRSEAVELLTMLQKGKVLD
jgi:tetratricopeptide (TPR) repeat protein